MRFLILSLVFLMLRIVFNLFLMMFAKTLLLFCCSCIRLFITYYVCVIPYAVMRNLDAIIRVHMVLCVTLMLLFVSVWCYAKPGCYYSCSYGVIRNLDAIIRVSNYVPLNPGLQRDRLLWSGERQINYAYSSH